LKPLLAVMIHFFKIDRAFHWLCVRNARQMAFQLCLAPRANIHGICRAMVLENGYS